MKIARTAQKIAAANVSVFAPKQTSSLVHAGVPHAALN